MSARPHVLIVEDDAEVRAALGEFLRMEGLESEFAVNGAEAIDRLQQPRLPGALVVDLIMPGIVGQELLEYMRGDEILAAIPVAIFSASPHLAPAGYPTFRKPLDVRSLLAFLRTAS
jgi:CheY-like chemotaxis protein